MNLKNVKRPKVEAVDVTYLSEKEYHVFVEGFDTFTNQEFHGVVIVYNGRPASDLFDDDVWQLSTECRKYIRILALNKGNS